MRNKNHTKGEREREGKITLRERERNPKVDSEIEKNHHKGLRERSLPKG